MKGISEMGEITIDLSKITLNEWRNFFNGGNTPEQDDAFVAKVAGMKPEQVGELLRDDWRRIIKAIAEKGREPLADPNSASPSTSD